LEIFTATKLPNPIIMIIVNIIRVILSVMYFDKSTLNILKTASFINKAIINTMISAKVRIKNSFIVLNIDFMMSNFLKKIQTKKPLLPIEIDLETKLLKSDSRHHQSNY
jgi:hypothetical protein